MRARGEPPLSLLSPRGGAWRDPAAGGIDSSVVAHPSSPRGGAWRDPAARVSARLERRCVGRAGKQARGRARGGGQTGSALALSSAWTALADASWARGRRQAALMACAGPGTCRDRRYSATRVSSLGACRVAAASAPPRRRLCPAAGMPAARRPCRPPPCRIMARAMAAPCTARRPPPLRRSGFTAASMAPAHGSETAGAPRVASALPDARRSQDCIGL